MQVRQSTLNARRTEKRSVNTLARLDDISTYLMLTNTCSNGKQEKADGHPNASANF